MDLNVPHPENQADLDQAQAALDSAKAACTEACVDEAVHGPHRFALESAYADFHRITRLVAGPPPPGPPNVTVSVE